MYQLLVAMLKELFAAQWTHLGRLVAGWKRTFCSFVLLEGAEFIQPDAVLDEAFVLSKVYALARDQQLWCWNDRVLATFLIVYCLRGIIFFLFWGFTPIRQLHTQIVNGINSNSTKMRFVIILDIF